MKLCSIQALHVLLMTVLVDALKSALLLSNTQKVMSNNKMRRTIPFYSFSRIFVLVAFLFSHVVELFKLYLNVMP